MFISCFLLTAFLSFICTRTEPETQLRFAFACLLSVRRLLPRLLGRHQLSSIPGFSCGILESQPYTQEHSRSLVPAGTAAVAACSRVSSPLARVGVTRPPSPRHAAPLVPVPRRRPSPAQPRLCGSPAGAGAGRTGTWKSSYSTV